MSPRMNGKKAEKKLSVAPKTRKTKRRLVNEEKVALIKLFRAQTNGGSQNQFCARHNISAFSKWTKRYNELLCAAPSGKIGRRRSQHRREKETIRVWASKKVSEGRQVDVHALQRFAATHTPSLFSRTKSNNARYVACFRLLRDLGPELELREMDMVTSSLLELHQERRTRVPVQRSTAYVHQENHTFVECDVADFTIAFDGVCVCTGSA